MAAQLSAAEADKEIRDLMRALEDLKTQPQPCLPCFEPPALDLKDLEDGSSCFERDTYTIRHAVFDWTVDLEKRRIEGTVTLSATRCQTRSHHEPTQLRLDAHRAMTVESIRWRLMTLDFEKTRWGDVGDEIVVEMPDDFREGDVTITYGTTGGPASTWLRPKQGGPALYATGQCCANRALFPCFDIPSQRFTWAASIRVKDEYNIVAAAEKKGERVEGGWRVCRFEMATPVPSYLVAMAIGVLERRDVGPRSTLYAHPSMMEAAEQELRGVPEKYLTAAETMFGPYAWGRFDVVVMPRAFARSSVAHPNLTFLAPSVIVGDGSLAYTVAHEVAATYFGALVTNASWAECFLNEGLATYASRRLTYEVDGAALADLEARVGRRLLEHEINLVQSEESGGLFSRLRVPINYGVDPDDTNTDVPYEKGFAFLCAMRDAVVDSFHPVRYSEDQKRAALDPFLESYVRAFAKKSIYAEDFVGHFVKVHKRAALQVDFPRWLDGAGVPPYEPETPACDASVAACEAAVDRIQTDGTRVGQLWRTWPTPQRAYFLDLLCGTPPEDDAAPPAQLYAFCRAAGLSDSRNGELTMRWALLVLRDRLELKDEDVERHLQLTARQKFVLPVFRALAALEPERAVNCLFKIGLGLEDRLRRKLDRVVEADPDTLADAKKKGAFAKLCEMHDKGLL